MTNRNSGLFVFLWIVLIASAPVASWAENSQFERLKKLAGTWHVETKEDSGMVMSFKVVANKTAVLEELVSPGRPTTVTVYHLNGDAIEAMHYCGSGSHPVMHQADGAEAGELRFREIDGPISNLADPEGGHMSGIAFLFHGEDSFTQKVTWKQGGREGEMKIDYVRAK